MKEEIYIIVYGLHWSNLISTLQMAMGSIPDHDMLHQIYK
jgi:hypothetical protein